MALSKITNGGVGTLSDGLTLTSDDPTITMTDSSGTNDIGTIQATSGALIVTARDGSADGEIIFKKTDGSATDETMRITSDGKVGIGTSSPVNTFQVNGDAMRVYNSADTDALHLISFDNNNHADYFMYTASGNNNVAIRTAEPSFFNGGKVYIGRTTDPYMSTGAVKRLSIDGGTTSTDATLVSNKNSASTMYHFYFHNSNSVVGSISTNASATSFNTSSDHRLKENINDITGAIARVKSLQPKRFNWITDPDDTTIDGFLAHECQTVVPEAITGTHNETRAATGIVKEAGGKVLAENVEQADWTANKGDNDDDLYPSDSTWTASENLPVYQTIDQSKLVPLLTAALKESIAKIETLETEMTALKARVTALEDA